MAATPPMGWNSWDAFGLTINESQFRANMMVMAAQLKEFGWQYGVIDEGWYLENPEIASMPDKLRYTLNARGQYEPALNRFPSAKGGAGFKPLSDAMHGDGFEVWDSYHSRNSAAVGGGEYSNRTNEFSGCSGGGYG